MLIQLLIAFCLIYGYTAQIFQYFIVNNKERTTKVIDTVKLPGCTHLDQRDNVTLRGGIKSGKFTKHGVVKSMDTCIDQCCQDKNCDVAFMPGTTCYTVKCYSEYSCQSIPAMPSNLPLGGIQISHIIRNGGKGDDLDEFRKQSGVNRNSKEKGMDKCVFSRVAYNQTIVGGDHAGEIIDLGKLVNTRDCAEKCCQHDNCEVAVIRNNKCFAVDCFTKNLCDSKRVPLINGNMHMLIYMNKRNNKREYRRELCKTHCMNGICINEDKCFCDVGFKGEHCDVRETKGRCDPMCGLHGKCYVNDTCLCGEGWEGMTCEKQIKCKPACEHGHCINGHTGECKCDFGWSGKTCNDSTSDRVVVASTGEQVLFTESEIEPELDIKVPVAPPMHGSESVSALAIALCCGLASAVLGAVVVVYIAKKILGKRAVVTNYEYLNSIPDGKREKQKLEDIK